jgi:hypothetical protein
MHSRSVLAQTNKTLVGSKAQSNLKSLLSAMSGPKKESTMNQSKNNWQNYRSNVLETQDVDKLNENRKNG